MSVPEQFWSTLPLGPGVEVLTHDANGLGALSKPAGILSHPNNTGIDHRALLAANYTLETECYQWTPSAAEPTGTTLAGASPTTGAPSPNPAAPVQLHLLNRLDSATSGVILVAADAALAASIRELFQRKRVRKIYQALVFGQPSRLVELWRDWLKVQKTGGQVRTGTGGGLMAETQATVLRQQLSSTPTLSLLKLEPRTGRSHQLRVQCAERHLPIVGDMTYGDFRLNREFAKAGGARRLFLHSMETGFDYEWQGRTHRFIAKAPLPPEFKLHR